MGLSLIHISGVYRPYEAAEDRKAEVIYFDDIALPESKIEVIESVLASNETDSILSAEVVVVGGRGAESEENFALLKAFADKLGAAIGGTRPLADTGFIPFEHQIGQTGFTIRPKICISLGVSGAIQHTEGIKDTKLFVAINLDAVSYTHLDVYKRQSMLLEYVPEGLQKLYNYKKPQREDLIVTLKTYLDRNQNLSKTAQDLYVHYKTAAYRIEKIAKITGIDFDNANEVLAVRIGLVVYKMIVNYNKDFI